MLGQKAVTLHFLPLFPGFKKRSIPCGAWLSAIRVIRCNVTVMLLCNCGNVTTNTGYTTCNITVTLRFFCVM